MLNCQVLIENLLQIKHSLVENKLKKFKTFDPSYFRGKSHFEEDHTQKIVYLELLN